jgi:K+/H+ antiporter YhaU regulatory subunit KhtT
MAPGPDYAFRPKDRMIVVGETAAINALREK